MRIVSAGLFLASLMTLSLAANAQMAAQMPQTALHTPYGQSNLEPDQLNLGLGFSTAYDDNAFITPDPLSQVLFSVLPNAAWNVARSHWTSTFNYNGMISESNKYSFYNRSNNTFNTGFTYQATKRLSFSASDNFIRAVDPMFTSAAQSGMSPGAGGNANPSYFGLPALLTSNGVNAEADYQYDAHTDVTIGGDYSFYNYSDIPEASLRDSHVAAGNVAFHHEFSARTTAGLAYDYTKITTPSGFAINSQRILLTGQYSFNPSMVLSIFAGPNYIANSFVTAQNGSANRVNNSNWTWSAGGTYAWTTPRMSMSGTVARQVSNGGGLIGSVQLSSFEYRFSRQLTENYSLSLHAAYTLDDILNPLIAQQTTAHYGGAGVKISRQLGKSFNASAAYDRMETLTGFYVGNPWIDRDRVTVAVNYTFTHPLGR